MSIKLDDVWCPQPGATVETLGPGIQEACKVLTCDAKEVNEQALVSGACKRSSLRGDDLTIANMVIQNILSAGIRWNSGQSCTFVSEVVCL
jgi:hypothetical protein